MVRSTASRYIIGVDEVGRGPLVGNIVAAAIILPPNHTIKGLTDSKKLSSTKRANLENQIKQQAIAWALGHADHQEIDQLNILQASLIAMTRAINALHLDPAQIDQILIDGNQIPAALPEVLKHRAQAIIGGDKNHATISAASIIAKEARDREMYALDEKYPQYGFAAHKGYPTKTHLQALKKHGPITEHRRSFRPVRDAILAANC